MRSAGLPQEGITQKGSKIAQRTVYLVRHAKPLFPGGVRLCRPAGGCLAGAVEEFGSEAGQIDDVVHRSRLRRPADKGQPPPAVDCHPRPRRHEPIGGFPAREATKGSCHGARGRQDERPTPRLADVG